MTDHDDDLRTRLSRLDPVPASEPVDPSTSPRARELLERTVQTPVQVRTEDRPRRVWRKPATLTAAAIAVVVLGVGAVIASSGGSSSKPQTTLPPRAKTVLALKAPSAGRPGRPGLNSCIQFTVDHLKSLPVAFGGTVTAVTDNAVTLTVDHWYNGGTADLVTIARTATGPGSEDGVDFTVDKQYLVTASQGAVVSCGYTGERTPELEQAFAEAFPG